MRRTLGWAWLAGFAPALLFALVALGFDVEATVVVIVLLGGFIGAPMAWFVVSRVKPLRRLFGLSIALALALAISALMLVRYDSENWWYVFWLGFAGAVFNAVAAWWVGRSKSG